MITLAALKASDIPDPELATDSETMVYSRRRGELHQWPLSKGRERSTGRIYYCLRLVDGFKTFGSLAELKRALR